jgi:hypothetical protein
MAFAVMGPVGAVPGIGSMSGVWYSAGFPVSVNTQPAAGID